MSQTVATPAIAAPTRLPRAPMANATSIETTPTDDGDDQPWPGSTRPRCGTSVKVVSPLRWLHSLVTERIAIIGRMIAIGMPIAAANCRRSARRRGEQDHRAGGEHGGDDDAGHQPEAGAGVEHLAQLDGDHAGSAGSARARVRRRGRRLAWTVSSGHGGHAAAPSRWVSAVSSRNISSRPAPSAARSSVRATPAARATLPTCVGRRPRCAGRRRRSASAVMAGGGQRRRRARRGRAARTRVPAAAQQLGLGALGDDPALADHDEVVGDDLDLVQQVRGEQHGAAAVGVPAEQVAHPADAGRVEAVGRLVEDQHLGVAEQRGARCRAAGACRASSCGPGGSASLGGQADQVEHLVDPAVGQAHRALRRWSGSRGRCGRRAAPRRRAGRRPRGPGWAGRRTAGRDGGGARRWPG